MKHRIVIDERNNRYTARVQRKRFLLWATTVTTKSFKDIPSLAIVLAKMAPTKKVDVHGARIPRATRRQWGRAMAKNLL